MLRKISKMLWSFLMGIMTLASIYGMLVAGNGIGAIPGWWIMDQVGSNTSLRFLGGIIATIGVVATFVITVSAAFFFGFLVTRPWEPKPLRTEVNGDHPA
jgi:uncharacterized membrane protein